MAKGSIGMITRITGPVVDIRFPKLELPDIYHALTVTNNGKIFTLEVLQHLGAEDVRCISMQPTDGMSRGMTAVDTGMPISVPVGE